MMTQNEISPALQARVDRLMNNADRLFALGNIRERCQQYIKDIYADLQPSRYADWGDRLRNDKEYLFAMNLILSYSTIRDKIVKWVKGCQDEYLLEEILEEREKRIEDFARMKIASRWYQIKDEDLYWRKFSLNIPFEDPDREKEIVPFFEMLSKICILTDIIVGHAAEYGLEVDYSQLTQKNEEKKKDNSSYSQNLSKGRQCIIDELLALVDKGDWKKIDTAEKVKLMLKTILGLGDEELTEEYLEMSKKLWGLLENGRGDREKIVWQNMVGYFDDKRLFNPKGSPALNKDFFGDEETYSNIDKGRPSRENMSSGFREVLPLLDKYCPNE